MDEILASGLTHKKASTVNAPMINECFMNLECKYVWEKEIIEGDDHVIICLEIVNIHIDERHMDESDLGRTGKTGILYNIHYPLNPEKVEKTSHDWIGIIEKYKDMGEY